MSIDGLDNQLPPVGPLAPFNILCLWLLIHTTSVECQPSFPGQRRVRDPDATPAPLN